MCSQHIFGMNDLQDCGFRSVCAQQTEVYQSASKDRSYSHFSDCKIQSMQPLQTLYVIPASLRKGSDVPAEDEQEDATNQHLPKWVCFRGRVPLILGLGDTAGGVQNVGRAVRLSHDMFVCSIAPAIRLLHVAHTRP